MNEHHFAKLLQILGVLLEIGVASILLRTFAEKKLRFLHEIFDNGQRILMPKGGFPPKLKRQLILSVLIFFSWILLTIAFIFDIAFLYWVSVSFLSINTLWHIVDVFRLPITNRPKQYTLKLLLFLLIMRLVNCLIMFPIVDTLLLFSIRIVSLIFLNINSIAKNNLIRFLFTLAGFTLIIAGLIWEFCLID